MGSTRILTPLVVTIATLVASASGAAILTVDTLLDVVDGGDGVLSLREALADANAGDEIQFDASLNGGTIVLSGSQLVVDENVTVTGPGSGLLTVDADLASRVFQVNVGVTAAISGLTLTRGAGASGAGINNLSTVTVTDCVVTGNSGSPAGGISNQGDLTLTRSSVDGNTGEGIRAQSGPVTIVESTVSNNTSSGIVAASGGAPILIRRSTFSGNTGPAGGAINNSSSAVPITLENSTISGNTATNLGGGIFAGGAPMTILSSTITNNTATNHGGGVSRGSLIAAGVVTIRNSIVAGNTAPVDADCSVAVANGMWATDAYNLFGLDEGCPVGATDMTTTDTSAALDPLGSNGGPTETHALARPIVSNQAVNAADPAGCTKANGGLLDTDQRGRPRQVGIYCDVGAVEQSSIVTAVPVVGALVIGIGLFGSAAGALRRRS